MANTQTAGLEATPGLRRITRKLFWWTTEDEALRDAVRFAAQVMTLGTWKDVQAVRKRLGDDLFVRALRVAPPGVFDEPSWRDWHLVYRIHPLPGLPKRKLP